MSDIQSPNFTQIPNVVFDYWMAKLKPTTFTVLLCLCRKTFGWHSTSKTISAKRLSTATGISKRTVILSLAELEELCLIKKVKEVSEFGYNMPNQYVMTITKPDDEIYSENEEMLEKMRGGGAESAPGVVQNLHQGSAESAQHIDKERVKEKEKKEEGECVNFSYPKKERLKAYGEFKTLKITESDYEKALAKYGEKETNEWIDKIDTHTASTGTTYKSLSATIKKWKKNPLPGSDGQGDVEKNKKYAEEIERKYSDQFTKKGLGIYATPQGLEINYGAFPKPAEIIKYSENGFTDQVGNKLRKLGITQIKKTN